MSLTINFGGEQEIDIPGARVLGIPSGKATFGFRRCELRFSLEGCQFPLDKVTYAAPFKRSVTVEAQRERATESQAGVTVGGTIGEKPSATGSGTLGFKVSGKTVEKVTTERWQAHYVGDEHKFAWVFEVKDGYLFLQGLLHCEPLGMLVVKQDLKRKHFLEPPFPSFTSLRKVTEAPKTQPDALTTLERLQLERAQKTVQQIEQVFASGVLKVFPSLTASLTVRPEDVRLTWGKVAWTRNITRNKLAAIECAIALRHIAPQLKDGLSNVRWQYVQH